MFTFTHTYICIGREVRTIKKLFQDIDVAYKEKNTTEQIIRPKLLIGDSVYSKCCVPYELFRMLEKCI